MSLLDKVVGAASDLFGQHAEGGHSLLAAIMQLVNNPQTGGLAGFMQSFETAGLGNIVKSWVSTGENLPISATQIESALGNERIGQFASQLGIDPAQASAKLAEYLPQAIDKLTPDGNVPTGESLTAKGLELLKSKLFG